MPHRYSIDAVYGPEVRRLLEDSEALREYRKFMNVTAPPWCRESSEQLMSPGAQETVAQLRTALSGVHSSWDPLQIHEMPPLQQQRHEAPPLQQQGDEAPPLQQQRDEVPPLQQQGDEAPPLQQQGDEVPPLQQQRDEAPPLQQQRRGRPKGRPSRIIAHSDKAIRQMIRERRKKQRSLKDEVYRVIEILKKRGVEIGYDKGGERCKVLERRINEAFKTASSA